MAEQQKRLQAYAREYYLMGNESITLAHDSRAAIANYDKALNFIRNIRMHGYVKASPSSMTADILKRKNA